MLNQDGTLQRHRCAAALWVIVLFPSVSQAESDPRYAIEQTRAVTVEVTVTQPIAGGRRVEYGAGFVIHPNGLVATTLHTVDRPGAIKITLPDSSVHSAVILSTFRDLDVAILKWQAIEPHPSVRISRRPEVTGGKAVVAGIPQRGERSLRVAYVNPAPSDVKYRLVSRSTKIVSFEADITLGFSGGPVMDMNGELIGLVLARNSNGLRRGYCLPADVLLTALGLDSLAGYPLPPSERMEEVAVSVAATETQPDAIRKSTHVQELRDDFSPVVTLSSELALGEEEVRR